MFRFKQFSKQKQEPNFTWLNLSRDLKLWVKVINHNWILCSFCQVHWGRLLCLDVDTKLALHQTAMSSKSELRYRCSHSNYITVVTSLSSVTVCKIWQIGPCCPRHCINIQPETVTCWKNIQSLGNKAGNNRRREPREYTYFTKCWSLFWDHGTLVNQPSGNKVMSQSYLLLRMPDLNHSELSWVSPHNLGFSATSLFTDRQVITEVNAQVRRRDEERMSLLNPNPDALHTRLLLLFCVCKGKYTTYLFTTSSMAIITVSCE